MTRFCRNGTSSSGISTPRSPRATITPSNAAMISSMWSIACGFSILAMTGIHSLLLVHDPAYVVGVVAGAHERQGDHVRAQMQRPAQVLDVLLAHRGHAHRDAGQVDALVVAERAADLDRGRHVGAVDLGRGEPDVAVVDQDLRRPAARRRSRPSYVVEQHGLVAR